MSMARTNTDAAPARPTADALAARLREEVAGLLAVPSDAVHADRPLPELGLEPAQMTELVRAVSRWLRRPVPAWTVWQYPTPAALAAHLTGDDRAARAAAGRRAAGHTPIAIVGLGCRLPGGIDSADALWQHLLTGPATAADHRPTAAGCSTEGCSADGCPVRQGVLPDDPGGFDAELFPLPVAEALLMGPHQRLALQTAWAALEDARLVPETLAARRTGLFLGVTEPGSPATGADGGSPCPVPGWDDTTTAARFARALGLDGPALAVAAANASGLGAVHLAVRALRERTVDLALAGGVHAPAGPAADRRCDGPDPVRGAGGGVLVLRRLSDALATGDRVYAVIRGTAVHRAGARGQAAATGVRDRADVLRAAWQDAGISPRRVAYVEAVGSGTPPGDPTGAGALRAVFADGRAGAPRIGSTQGGHLRAAAGTVGLMKTALALYHGELPAVPLAGAGEGHDAAATERTPWPGDGRRYAGVGDDGSDGAPVHLALEEAPYRRRLFVPLAADSADGLRAAADALTGRARAGGAWYAPEHLGRAAGAHRVVATAGHPGDLSGALDTHLASRLQAPATRPDALAFCFSGPGSQWHGMGRDLLGEPVFRAAFDACDQALRPYTGWSVTEELLADRAGPRLGRTDVAQPLLFALQTALARTLGEWGAEPGVVFGQSVGEVAAAVFAGALPLDEGARLIAVWSRLVTERAAGDGALTVCELSVEEAESLPVVRAGRLSLAGHLAPGQVCLSGPREAVGTLERDLEGLGVRAVRVNIDHAAHSARLARLAPEFERRLGALRTRPTAVPFWSTATGGYAEGTDLGAAYWARSMCTPMRLAEATRALAGGRRLRVVEITPHPVVSHSLRRGLDAVGGDQPRILSTGRRGQGARQSLEDVAAALWCDGADVRWGAVTGRRRRSAAPLPVALTVSGRTARARAENAARLAARLDGTADADLPDVAYTAARHRSHLEYRASVVAASSAEAAGALRALADGRTHRGLITGRAAAGPGLAVLFTGEGDRRPGAGRGLYGAFPEFRRALDEACAALDPYLPLPLAAVLFAAGDGPDAKLVHDPRFAQPGLFAVGVALFRLWRLWGVAPAAVAGRAAGEIAAAHAAGVLDLADAARLVAARGRLTRAREWSGATAAAVREFRQVAAECVFREPSIAWASTVTGGVAAAGTVADPEYWVRQACAAPRFTDALRALERAGAGRRLECRPAGVDEVRSLTRALGALHVAGQDIRWERVFAAGVPVDLPGHAFRRASCPRVAARTLPLSGS
ncbi:acyltransferase domain-containing protein [Streptomyces griseofuscus]|uniref:acyltransferase domain-containing protein n=1 Tax=Streptomyces griseofuscus TaxID=146922 RepID=UPI0036BA8524